MPATEKVLWVVNYSNLDDFVARSVFCGATGVAIRTDNDVAAAIPRFHAKNIQVFGWRWPSAALASAMAEATRAVGLFGKGLDGYFADPEKRPGHADDWDKPGLAPVAEEFCKTITAAAPGKPFGTTSHFRGALVYPSIPWGTFFKYSTVLLPQAYWRSDEGVIGHGKPDENYKTALDAWVRTGGGLAKIVPMAGELTHATAAEIDTYAQTAAAANVTHLHFYAYDVGVSPAIWDAIKRA